MRACPTIRIGVGVTAECEPGSPSITPAHLAVEMQDLPRLRQLIDEGADIADANGERMTLLLHAVDVEGDGAVQTGKHAHVDTTAFLLTRGADPGAAMHDGTTPLSLARQYGHWLVVELWQVWRQTTHERICMTGR